MQRTHRFIGTTRPRVGAGPTLLWAATLVACRPPLEERPDPGVEVRDLDPGARAVAEAIGTMHWLHLVEIERGEVAARRATREGVRAYADRVVRDHGHVDARLLQLAERLQVRPGSALGRNLVSHASSSMGELEDLRGIALDRAYLKASVDAHDRMISRFIEAQAVANDELAHHIGTALPIMIQHRDLAFRMLAQIPTA
jgi:putative membrane protein